MRDRSVLNVHHLVKKVLKVCYRCGGWITARSGDLVDGVTIWIRWWWWVFDVLWVSVSILANIAALNERVTVDARHNGGLVYKHGKELVYNLQQIRMTVGNFADVGRMKCGRMVRPTLAAPY